MATKVSDATEGGRLPPQSLEAERSVLGAMLLDREAVARVIEILDESCFYREAHRKIYRAVIDLYEKNEAVDFITLSNALARTGQIEAVGGPGYLTTLFEFVATSANVEYHSRIVLEKAMFRKLIQVSTQIASTAYEAREDAAELIDRAEHEIFAISDARLRKGFVPLKQLLTHSFEVIQELYDQKRHVTGVPSGFRDLDELTSGFQKSDLVIVAGRPSMGKTSLVLNIAEYVAIEEKPGVPVAIFSLEMSKEQLVQRLLCSQARIEGHRLRRGYLGREDWPRLTTAAGRLSEAPIYIDDSPAMGVLEMRAKARRLKAEIPLGLIIVDYVQLIRGAAGVENRQQEISQISRALKALAKELDVPVVALSQLSRAVETRGGDRRPVLSDLRECVPANTMVVLADGRRVPIAELEGSTPEVLAMSRDEHLVPARSDRVWRVGTRPVFRVAFASGRTLRATENHRIYSRRGWVRVRELKKGDRIAVAERIRERLHAHVLVACDRYAADLRETPPGAGSDLCWDPVVGITPCGAEPVYDLTVPGPASWLADGIVCHNSGALEQDADLVIFIYRAEMYERTSENQGIAEILIRKQRNGPTGDVQLKFFSEFALFRDLDRLHVGEETAIEPEPYGTFEG